MSSLMSGELQATCSALGYSEGDKYFTEPDCTYALKDLIRYLKHDDDNHTVRRELGNMKIMVTDLLPLFCNHWEDKSLLDIVLRLLVNLTNPALILYEEIPTDRILRNHYLEIIHYCQCYKEAFTSEKIFAVLTKKLGELISLDWEHRQEEDRLIIERILILVRNVLHIPPNPQQEKRTDTDATVHDLVLWSLHLSGMEDILLYIASCKEENNLCVHVIEIISLMFREQDASQLAVAGLPRTKEEKQRDFERFNTIRERELSEKRNKLVKFNSMRHSRFGGTYTVQNFKSISNNAYICHQPLAQASSLNFDRNKSITKRPRNRALAQDTEITRKSTISIQLFLKEFCIEFLNSSYNYIMNVVKDNLVRQKAEEHDETYYMWAMRFFMEFNRIHEFKVDLVSETISLQTFHFVQTEIDKNLEMIRIEKKKIHLWARRLQFSTKAYAELINTLVAMDKVKDSRVRDSSRVLKGNIFYLTEYRELPILLLHSYDEIKMPKSYLKVIVELIHTFLKVLQEFSKGSSHLMVKEKKKKKIKKKKLQNEAPTVIIPDLESKWENIANDVSAAIQGHLPLADDVQPFDAASDRSMENQCADTMRQIQSSLRDSNISSAVALFRAARDIWPEDGAFGTSDIQPEEEFLALREIFFAPLPEKPEETVRESGIDENVNDSQDEEEEAEILSASTSEHEFNYQDFVQRFASPRTLQPYTILLRNFAKNSIYTNHCIAKIFHRIAFDLKKPGLLYQATIFRSFQKIFCESSNASYKELIKLGKFILEKFFANVKNNNKIFMEILFWKGSSEVYEMEQGYGTYDTSKKAKALWSEEEEDELRRLHEEFKDGATDVVDSILDHLIDKTKTRRQVIVQLKRQNLITNTKQLTKRPLGQSRRSSYASVWSEEEEVQLRHLFSQHKDSLDIVNAIELGLEVKHSKRQIIEKILQLGLVTNKKELYKKRSSKKDSKGTFKEIAKNEQSSESEISSDECVDEYVDDMREENLASLIITPELKSSAEWLRDTLKEASEDRIDGDIEPTAIVPISENEVEAVNNLNFINVMQKFGLLPPEEGQESFWRIPRHLTSSMLDKRIQYLDRMLNENGESVIVGMDKEKSLQTLKAKRDRSRKHVESEVMSRDEISTETNQSPVGMLSERDNMVTLSKINKPRRKNKNVVDSSDDEIPIINVLRNSNSDTSNNIESSKRDEHSLTNKTRRILQNEDDSSDDERLIIDTDEAMIQEEKNTSNENNMSGRKRRFLDDDEDDDDDDVNEAISRPLKRIRHVLEDSEEESMDIVKE